MAVVHVQGKRLEPITPTAVLFLSAMLKTVPQLQILDNI
jgi:hypothetical protein